MGERRGGWIRRALEEQAPEDGGAAARPAAAITAPARSTTIERGCEIEGNLCLPGPLLVHGDFRGSIECGDAVTVCAGASVQARVRARSVVIHGSVVGDVEARRDVILHAGARLHGDVKTPSLVISAARSSTAAPRWRRRSRAARTRRRRPTRSWRSPPTPRVEGYRKRPKAARSEPPRGEPSREANEVHQVASGLATSPSASPGSAS
jgi:cytoskeletal protein CcmA (bactofilin family)